MRSIFLLAPIALAACMTVPPNPPAPRAAPPPPAPTVRVCNASGLDRFIGQLANTPIAEEIRRASGSREMRWTGPGIMVTMDLRDDRVNAELDATLHRIVRIYCG